MFSKFRGACFLISHFSEISLSDITWGEVGDLTEKDISKEEQDRLLSEYEREMLTKKMKNGEARSVVEDSIGEELAKLDMKDKKTVAGAAGRKAVSPDKGMHQYGVYMVYEMGWCTVDYCMLHSSCPLIGKNRIAASSGSDDWEKLSSGERSPRKGSRDVSPTKHEVC